MTTCVTVFSKKKRNTLKNHYSTSSMCIISDESVPTDNSRVYVSDGV